MNNYWDKMKREDPSYVKTFTWTKPEVAAGVPAYGNLPLETLTAIVDEYGVDKSLPAERAKALAQKHNLKDTEVVNYWGKLRQRDPNYQIQTYVVDGKSDERFKAKARAKARVERESRLSIRRQLDVLEPSMKAFDGVRSSTLTFHVRAGGSLRRRTMKCARR